MCIHVLLDHIQTDQFSKSLASAMPTARSVPHGHPEPVAGGAAGSAGASALGHARHAAATSSVDPASDFNSRKSIANAAVDSQGQGKISLMHRP